MGHKVAIRVVFAILAIAFFAAPVALRALGVTAEQFENRRLADPPELSQGWGAFQQTSQYLIDRMPLRAQAVRANTRIWTDVFGTDPPYGRDTALAGDKALPFAGALEDDDGDLRIPEEQGDLQGPARAETGKRGWLYNSAEFEFACASKPTNRQVVQRWSELVRAIRASGRETALFVAPHKASVYPEYLPDEYPSDHCALEAKERFWSALSKAGRGTGVRELRSELVRLKAHVGDGLFELLDMHWTTLGALTLVDAALDAVGGDVRLEPEEIVERGLVPYEGDLSAATGDPETAKHMEYGIDRAPDAPVVPGRTLLLCDSFAYRWMRLFKPYFEQVRYVPWYHPASEIVGEIERSDRVIVEANETFIKSQAEDGNRAAEVIHELGASRGET
jgi:alginate O-acetyltransferase complex protein AlgJ